MVDYGAPLDHPFEKKENPQAYDEFAYAYTHKHAARHILGVVGGNEVSLIKGNRVDLESDLLGITRPNSWCTDRKHLPPKANDTQIKRKNPKEDTFSVNVTKQHLPVFQMWAYPVTLSPLPVENQVCKAPHKY
jgi:hypothetical protein